MAELSYVLVPTRLKEFLAKVPSTGIPDRLTAQELVARGFKSSNDRAIISVLRFLGFLDSSGKPTEVWKAYRDRSRSPRVLAAALEKAYVSLYSVYPDAHIRSDEELRNLMSTRTKAGERVIHAMVQTFKVLASLASFDPERSAWDPDAHGDQVSNFESVNARTLTQPKSRGIISLELPSMDVQLTCSSRIRDRDVEDILDWIKMVATPWLKFHAGLNAKRPNDIELSEEADA